MGRSTNGVDAYANGNADELPEHSTLSGSIYLDTFEVTVGRFRNFVTIFSDYTPPQDGLGDHNALGAGWQSAWNSYLPTSTADFTTKLKCDPTNQTWTDQAGPNENMPINCVSWYEAMAFCLWDGGRLATEAEWEYAAAGSGDNRLFPWGSTDPSTDTSLANDIYSNKSPLVNVGSHPKGQGLFGQYDLAGSVWEWVMDWYDPNWYSGDGNNCQNCCNVADTAGTTGRVYRGGGYNSDSKHLRAAVRVDNATYVRSVTIGIRCAKTFTAP
jgi:formylglycine-generating enzyme required for sulfatase activity